VENLLLLLKYGDVIDKTIMFTDEVSDLPDSELKRAISPILRVDARAAGMVSTTPNVNLTPSGVQEFTKHIIDRGIFSPNPSGTTELPESALVISPGMLSTEIMKSRFGVSSDAESIDLINRELLKVALHEIGHGVSEKAGLGSRESEGIRGRLDTLYNIYRAKQAKDSGDVAGLNKLKGEIDTATTDLMRAKALEEARAESFSYGVLPDTELGKKMLEETKSDKFKDAVKGSASDVSTRKSTFTGTLYYNLTGKDRYSTPFSGYYGDAGLGEDGKYQQLFGDDAVKQARTTADVVGSGTILRSSRFWGIWRSF